MQITGLRGDVSYSRIRVHLIEGLERSGFLTPRDRNDKLSIPRALVAAARAAVAASDREVALKAAKPMTRRCKIHATLKAHQ